MSGPDPAKNTKSRCCECIRRATAWLSAFLVPAETAEEDGRGQGIVAAPTGADASQATRANETDWREKMNYQLEIDKKKARDQFRYTWCGIVWDKGCFALLVGLAAAGALFFGNIILEDYRMTQARERTLTEKRIEALTAISAAHSKMTRAFFRYSHEEPDTPPDKAKKEYGDAIDNLMHEINKHLVLLGADFDKNTSWYIMLHRSCKEIGVTKCDKYGTLASNMDNEFNAFCEAYIKKGKYPKEDRIVVRPSSREERLGMKPEEYINKLIEYRKQHGKNDTVLVEQENHP